ncbi:MAG: acyl-CoA dehydrogenase family protein [Deltaproteobacteria bacterium]|nr:acyl-CoA dehydrogenase family protein [Deltaproteobacteria bacterium]
MPKDFFNPDIEFFLDQRVDWARIVRFAKPDVAWQEELDTYKMILRTTGEVCEAIDDGARDHWHEHARVEGGEVVVPPHIAAGYAKLKAAGLVSLPVSAEYGGYGLPFLINSAYLEMVARADPSLMTIVGLQAGAAHDIEVYGSDALKRRYLPGFASGETQGCMDLTEPQAGSDLGGILTKATPHGDHYLVEGEKIFITNGGAEVHLVLARDATTFEQTRGTTNGLSLILCPRTLPDGRRNRISVPRVESKLGIHGSPTCVVQLDGAEGYLLGTAGQGFKAMLELMNGARLGVAAQAIGIAEGAYRAAREYAAQRVQFGAPIIEQPLVKSMLTQMAMQVQAARALLYRTCALLDLTRAMGDYLASPRAAADPDAAALREEHERNTHLVRFLTPLSKYYATELSNDVARRSVQVHGGLGYMAESRAGQYHSDSIITTIYEGTSEIQASFALKEMSKGALFAALDAVSASIDGRRDGFQPLVDQVHQGIEWIHKSLNAVMGDPRYALLNAKRLCDMVIDVLVAAELLAHAPHADAKRELAQSFIHRRMLMVEMNARRVAGGDASRIQRYDTILGV